MHQTLSCFSGPRGSPTLTHGVARGHRHVLVVAAVSGRLREPRSTGAGCSGSATASAREQLPALPCKPSRAAVVPAAFRPVPTETARCSAPSLGQPSAGPCCWGFPHGTSVRLEALRPRQGPALRGVPRRAEGFAPRGRGDAPSGTPAASSPAVLGRGWLRRAHPAFCGGRLASGGAAAQPPWGARGPLAAATGAVASRRPQREPRLFVAGGQGRLPGKGGGGGGG